MSATLAITLAPWPVLCQEDVPVNAVETDNSTEQPIDPSSLSFSGTLDATYGLRRFSGRSDKDLQTFLSLRAEDIVADRLDAAISLYWHDDLDGLSSPPAGETVTEEPRPGRRGEGRRRRDAYEVDPRASDPFLDLDQAADNDFRLYTAYANLNHAGIPGGSLRLGRQFIDEIDFVHFDGASVQLRPTPRVDAKVFGGRPVSFFSGTSGESLYGTRGEFRPTSRARAAATYYRYEGTRVTDKLLSVEGWYRWSPWTQSHLKYSWLNSDPYIVQTDHFFRADSADLDLSLQTVSLLEPVGASTLNFNPYFPLLNSFTPFDYGSILAIKGLGERLSLRAGIDLRRAEGVDDPVTGFNNRDFRRGTLGVEVRPAETLTLALDAEYWEVDADDRFSGLSGEVDYRPTSRWTLTAGAEYGEYVQVYRDELAFLFGEEKTFRITPDVITYFASARWQDGRVALSAALEHEDNSEDSDDWLRFQMRLGLRF
ncbi:MAG: hypothetical protein KFF45_07515 [Thioalkalivibrio sp.]|nr:hypothetical protein [Thioalkalivibrio sp.]